MHVLQLDDERSYYMKNGLQKAPRSYLKPRVIETSSSVACNSFTKKMVASDRMVLTGLRNSEKPCEVDWASSLRSLTGLRVDLIN